MKRFTSTDKWDDPWFRKLKPRYKTFLQYIWDRCDGSGVWTVDLELAATYVGEKVDPDEALQVFAGRVIDTKDGKWLVPGFIPFQWGELSPECRPHRPIITLVRKHGLEKNGRGYLKGTNTLPDKTSKGISTLKDKDKEQDKEEEGVQGEEVPPPADPPPPLPVTAEEIYAAYPLKAGKPDALRAVHKALKVRDPTFLLTKTREYAAAVDGTDTLIPHPATWFNAERYNDDPSTWVRQHPLTRSDVQMQITAKENRMAELRRKHFSETQSLNGGVLLPAGWRDEQARGECVNLRRETENLKLKLSRMT